MRGRRSSGGGTARRPIRIRGLTGTVLAAVVLSALLPATTTAAERFAVIVSGVSGGEKFAEQQQRWHSELAAILTLNHAFAEDNIVVLDEQSEGSARATADNVRRLLSDLRRRMTADDTVFVVLLGHGTFDGTDAKFNLVGPDLSAAEWTNVIDGLPGRVVVVNTTASSFPFLERLSRRGRIVITATDSPQQRYATVFPEYFIRALADASADVDKNGRVSVWEAFASASAGVKRHYERRGQLPTERPLLDDNGDRVGREAEAPGDDGAEARAVYLGPEPRATSTDEALQELEHRRTMLEQQLGALKARRPLISEQEYQAELERILVELAKVAREIRQRS